jgi:hypothetical protein
MNATRWIPLSGTVAVILIAAGAVAAGSTPREDAPVNELVAFYAAHDTGQVVSGVLLSLGALFFLIFCAALVSALPRTDVELRMWLVLSFGGGVLFVAGLTIAAGLAVFIGNVAGGLDPAALQALHEASLMVVFPWTVGTSAFLLGAGVGVLQSKPLPRWLGWIAVGLGVVAAIPNHVLGGVLDHIGIVPVAGLGIWTLLMSVALARRSEPVKA